MAPITSDSKICSFEYEDLLPITHLVIGRETCGSELARDEAGTFNIDADGQTAIAAMRRPDKPAPTVTAFHIQMRQTNCAAA
jgi:hypothetical protein